MNDVIESLTHDQMVELLEIYAKNLVALDGTWFQSVERDDGMDAAMHHDREAWRRFSVSEARRIKGFLGLPEHPGLEGLAQALPLRELLYRIVDCRVQNARDRKGMGFHPCKSVGIIEYGVFAENIDDRIACECLSCYPEIEDETCNCSWKFTLK